ncbi:MAG: exo-alpha-sialidase [Planctomycetes bacterium]|nr:exo-alpha-sialidase [Planctomycetota bacterium]
MRIVQTQMIWDAAPHNAFTDLARWNGRWCCSFREGAAHSSYDGAARILISNGGRAWRRLVCFADAGLDLRDPKLCVLPDGRLLLGVGVRRQIGDEPDRWETASRVYVTRDGEAWDGPHTVGDSNVWMWRYAPHREFIYSFGYAKPQSKSGGGETFLRLYRSRNGVDWDTVTQTEAGGGYVNETAFVFEPDDRCVALLRREGGNSRLGVSQPPYARWTWTDLDERFNGPALLRLPDGRLLAGGRSKALGASSSKTAMGWLTTDPPALRPLLWLPSQHETGYPGLAFHEGRVWASYYSSQSGKCAIYMAELELLEER